MIGGNTTIKIQIKDGFVTDSIGKKIPNWVTVQELFGFVDLSSGDSPLTTYNAKIVESTHIFMSDWVQLDERIKAENCRVVDEQGAIYDVKYIDDPMWLHRHFEIFLKYTGGQYGT